MDKLLKIKRPDLCVACAVAIPVGTMAYWNPEQRTLTCLSCRDPTPSVTPSASAPNAEPLVNVPDTVPAGWSSTKPDVAGHSAQKEFEKRAAKELVKKQEVVARDAAWRIEIRERRPLLGRLVTAVTPKPQIGPLSQSTTAWDKGAAGERRVAEILEALHGIEVLHDRLIPRKGAANIDHIAVAAAGIFVIDAKKYDGTLEVRDKGTRFRTDDRLYVAGRDRTKLTDGVIGQVEAVRTVLGEEWNAIPVYGVLCFIGCDWTKLKPKFLNGVTVTWPKGLPEHVMKPGPHLAQADAIASLLRRSLKQPK
jgi:Nuclease-related domain